MTSRPSTEQLLVQVLMRAAQEVLRTLEEASDEAPERTQSVLELELAFGEPHVVGLKCDRQPMLYHSTITRVRFPEYQFQGEPRH